MPPLVRSKSHPHAFLSTSGAKIVPDLQASIADSTRISGLRPAQQGYGVTSPRHRSQIGMIRGGTYYNGTNSLAAVRLLPIQSRPQAPSMENPLDRHRTRDVLLLGTTLESPASPQDPIQSLVGELADVSSTVQHKACHAILEDLSSDKDHIKSKEYIDAGLLANIKCCLRMQENPGVQLLSLKIISNLVSGPAHLTESVVTTGCAPYLVPLVSSPHPSISEEAVWALGNMAGDSSQVRELVLRTGIMPVLLKVIASDRWAQTRDEVTAIFAQKLNSASSAKTQEFRYSTPPPKGNRKTSMRSRRSASFPTASTPQNPREVEVRQPVKGGTVMNLIVPSIEVPRTAGPNHRTKEDKC